jgi:hypothetical protein
MDLNGVNFYFVHTSPNARMDDQQLTSIVLLSVSFTMTNMYYMIQEELRDEKEVMR